MRAQPSNVIGTDFVGRTWVRTADGSDLPLTKVEDNKTKQRMTPTRKLRLQRTIGFGISIVMGISYIVDKWVW